MAFSYTCLTLQRAVIPIVLVLSALYRPVGISFVYLLMFFISPFIPIATTRNFRGSVTPYLIILIALSTILLLCHIALQLTIIALKPNNLFGTCGFTEQLLRHVGFIDFRNIQALAIVEWLAPEVLVFLTSLAAYLVIKKLTTVPSVVQLENGEVLTAIDGIDDADNPEEVPAIVRNIVSNEVNDEPPNFETLIKISPLFCLATLFFAAVLRPSVPGGFYFLIFLLSGSYWATFKSLERGFAVLLRFVMIILVCHVICIVSYQTPWMQQNVDSRSLLSRLISLEPLITSNCVKDIRIIVYDTNFKADSYLSPIVMLFSYYALALTTKNLIKPSIVTKPTTALGQHLENGSNKFQRQISLMTQTARGSKKESWTKTQRLNVSIRREQRSNATEPTETTPLVRNSTRKSAQDQDKTSNADIPLDALDEANVNVEDTGTSLCDQISYGIISVGGFIYQNSYIFTNILMMAWSIVYHSWLTFVLLLWANVLWMIPNQRKAMMRSSPFIVLYAELLLVAQYIYGMDLTNDELPSKVDTTGINLIQIGLKRPQEDGIQPCVPLIVKTSFLLMFWVTLRQFFKEKTEKQQRTDIADIAGPIRVTIASTTVEDSQAADKKTSKILKKVGAIIKNLLVRLWVWLLVLVIFLCAITGKQMTGFRICYMALFLFFLLVFQSSSKAWLKIMYGFWLFLIFYAMSILILVYTYQFDKFDQYWSYYLNISKTLQTDIGLERFKTKDLLLQLVSPTIIVILTVIQVHYFHNRFIDSLQQARVSPRSVSQRVSNGSNRSTQIAGFAIQGSVEQVDFEESMKDLIRRFFKKLKHQSKRFFKNLKGVFWRLLELHMIKLVYITAFVCSIKEVCVLHIVFIGLCVLGTISQSKFQIFLSRIISFIVTIIILTKMIYQVAYLDHNRHNVECPNLNASHGSNNAVWFGLQKASEETGGLIGLLRRYIVYMVMVTLHAVVTLRQYQMRSMLGKQNEPLPKVLFPYIKRADAEKNLNGMIKYMLNYGFYKFGFEISLIALAITITYRGDFIAVVYVCWLAVLLIFDRKRSRNIWSIFQIFIAASILLQYILFVGLPPSLCLQYPWENIVYSESIQIWALLPGGLRINHAQKLVFDFIVLMIVNRQKRVFNIETIYAMKNEEYPGGSNKSVLRDIANMGLVAFENPTRDFLSNIRNYLDVFENAILCGFYWVTLAVVFLAGTNIADVLALGYLIGAFVFLWQGSDFYLNPINVILRRWHWLIIYNVSNIVIKTCLQMTGCLFMQQLTDKCCWLVHLLGITCSSRIAMLEVPDDELFATNECPATKTQVVLVWDTLCFAFLLFQLRIFKSHYFCHIINDTKANTILASRGADIIEDLRQKQIEHRQQHEQEVLHKIKRKMEKIRATQQKMLRPIDKPTHYDELAQRAVEESRLAPLARQISYSSCPGSGYHTPDDDDDSNASNSLASSSSSSSSSAPVQLLQNVVITCDDEFADVNSLSEDDTSNAVPAVIKVIKPPRLLLPYPNNQLAQETCLPPMQHLLAPTSCSLHVNVSGGSSVISSSLTHNGRRRQSSVNAAVSWNETVSVKCTPMNYEPDADQMVLSTDPFFEHGYPIPGSRVHKRKEIKLHPQAVRAGDYYMFEDMDEKFELDLIEDEVDYLDDKVVGSEKKMTRRRTLIDVWKDIQSADYRRQMYVRQRSYASAPGSRVGIKIDEELNVEDDDAPGVRNSTFSEPIDCARRSKSENFELDEKKTKEMGPSTSKQAAQPVIQSEKQQQQRDADGITSTEEQASRPSATYDIQSTDDIITPSQSKMTLEAKKSDESKKKSDTDSTDATGKETKVEKDDDSSDEDLTTNPIIRLLEAFLVSLTIRLNRCSRNYRYVNKILIEEKRLLKESRAFHRISHSSPAAMFNMMKSKLSSENVNDDDDDTSVNLSASSTSSNNALNNINKNATNIKKHKTTTANDNNVSTNVSSPTPPPSSQTQSQSHEPPEHVVDIIELPLDTVDAKITSSDQDGERSVVSNKGQKPVPEIRVLMPSATASPGDSNSKILSREKEAGSNRDFNFEEDFTSRQHNIILEVLIASWYAILSNTDLICYTVVFINQVVNASIISLPLPIMVFLWGTLSLPRPTKTFWVTLIAYSQIIVIIKCIFQYKLIWANYINLPNQPLSPAKIFGVELSPHYASYDLLLLLVLFLHRFVLKSQGLWKSDYNREFITKTLAARNSKPTVFESENIAAFDTPVLSENIALEAPPPPPDGQDSQNRSQSPVSTETAEYMQGISKLRRGMYLSSLRKFFFNLVKKTRLPTDVYALMFLCDFVNFFVMLFGFTAFGSQQNDGKSASGVQTYLAENKVPIPFLIMLLVQFILIVIDRALYLRKALVYKIVFHYFSVIGIHIWMFFVVPAVTERSFYSLAPPIIFYIIKCFYLLLSSYQIKCGYPQRILGNFLTKGFSLANMISFKLYMQIPFLYELRTVLDWVSTDTTMTLFDWLKMEDIFAHIYFIKCSRQMETDFPAVRAQKKGLYIKMLMGGTLILVLVIAIWGPLCLFALGNAVGTSNVPFEIATTIRIGPYDPIYATNNRESIYVFDKPMYAKMQNAYMKDRSAITFLASYDASDIAAIGLAGNSPSLWSISPPDKQRLLNDLRNNVTLIARFSYSFTRIPHAKNAVGSVHAEVKYRLNETFAGREAMIRMIEGSSTEELVVLPELLPKFIKVLNSGELTIVGDLMPLNEEYRPLIIKMKADDITKEIWWEIREFCNDTFHTNTLSKLPLSSCSSGIVMYTFNDKKFPSTFSFLTAGGIIGLYTTFVVFVSRFIKAMLSDQHRKVMFEDLPYVDRVLQLCLDIYLVREALEFALEEDLFAKLIFLYRSPETMIKWTRPREEAADDETDTESVRSRAIMRREHQ